MNAPHRPAPGLRAEASPRQRRAWALLSPAARGDGQSRAVDVAIIALILASAASTVLATDAGLAARFGLAFAAFEAFSVLAFTAEYLARLWAAPADARYGGRWGRLRWARTPLAVVDLLAVLPFYLPLVGLDLRAFRLLRLLRLAKFGRYVPVFAVFQGVFRRTRAELLVTLEALTLLLLLAAAVMYFLEGAAQPEAFHSIPAAMWWAINTLTTVGYGDVVPVTGWGRLVGGVVAVIGICFLALPTAILGAGFVAALEAHRGGEAGAEGAAEKAEAAAAHAEEAAREAEGERCCPACGRPLGAHDAERGERSDRPPAGQDKQAGVPEP